MNPPRYLAVFAVCLLLAAYAGRSGNGSTDSGCNYLERVGEIQASRLSEAEAERRATATDYGVNFGALLLCTAIVYITDAVIRFESPHLVTWGSGLAIELVLGILLLLDCVLLVAWLDAEFRN